MPEGSNTLLRNLRMVYMLNLARIQQRHACVFPCSSAASASELSTKLVPQRPAPAVLTNTSAAQCYFLICVLSLCAAF